MNYEELWFSLKKELVNRNVTFNLEYDRKVLSKMADLEVRMFEKEAKGGEVSNE